MAMSYEDISMLKKFADVLRTLRGDGVSIYIPRAVYLGSYTFSDTACCGHSLLNPNHFGFTLQSVGFDLFSLLVPLSNSTPF